jgi:putative transposase
LAAIEQARARDPGLSLTDACRQVGLARATFYRWQSRQAEGGLVDRVVTPSRHALPPTPEEVRRVRRYAEAHPLLGYKRLTWAMVDEDVVYLRPWMIYRILAEHTLLGRRRPAPEGLRRPAPADHPDQRWHTDLMTLYFGGRWFWALDVLDAYSRYLVHCEVLLTARAHVVHLALQQAIDTLDGRERRPGEPEIVHDGGPQFLSREWRFFVASVGMSDVRTMPYHPQSNGLDERVHRTIREEVPLDPEATLYQVQQVIGGFRSYYNEQRPHSALRYLRPMDYYRGDPEARLAEREAKLKQAAEARRQYWRS